LTVTVLHIYTISSSSPLFCRPHRRHDQEGSTDIIYVLYVAEKNSKKEVLKALDMKIFYTKSPSLYQSTRICCFLIHSHSHFLSYFYFLFLASVLNFAQKNVGRKNEENNSDDEGGLTRTNLQK